MADSLRADLLIGRLRRDGHFIDGEYLNEDAARVPVARPSDGAVSASFPIIAVPRMRAPT